MSESRKIHQSDGEQARDGDHVALDGDKEFRNSRLSLSKEKASPDGAHEKLLQKEDEAKIVRVDMVDAKFVSGDHRNGDPKIELDANKKQFSGLTKEELMKYADDPFWVNLRWCMFVLFWALWLGMLAGAVAIIVNAPKCARPASKTWFEKGPLVQMNNCDVNELESVMPILQSSKVQGLFCSVPTYAALDDPSALTQFKDFVDKATKISVKVVVDLIPNYVSNTHSWFVKSENNSAPYNDYFVWSPVTDYDDANNPKLPNNWVSKSNIPAWTLSTKRNAFYMHHFERENPDLNFKNKDVVELLAESVSKWMSAGAAGIRLDKARLMLVGPLSRNEEQASARAALGADHQSYAYYRHDVTSDQPGLSAIFKNLLETTRAASKFSKDETVFTLKEDGERPELYLRSQFNTTTLVPPSAAPVPVQNATAAAALINRIIKIVGQEHWPIIQLTSDRNSDKELASFALLLPAAPLFDIKQLDNETNSESLSHLVSLRSDDSVAHGHYHIAAAPAQAEDLSTSAVLACARWKTGHTGYVSVFNPLAESVRANLTALPSVPAVLTVHHASHDVRADTNYTNNYQEKADNVQVPAYSTVVLSYVPQSAAEN